MYILYTLLCRVKCVWQRKYLVSVSHTCSVFVVFVRLNRHTKGEEKHHLVALYHTCEIRCACRQHIVLILVSHGFTGCRYHFQTQTANISSSVHFFISFPSCRWIWLLCRSSFRRWPSGTRASPAPVHVRTDSQEGWAPLVSWTTGWQRLVWTDRGNSVNPFSRVQKAERLRCVRTNWHWGLPSWKKKKIWVVQDWIYDYVMHLFHWQASWPPAATASNWTLSARSPVKNMATWMMHDSLLESHICTRLCVLECSLMRNSVSMAMKKPA